jgi:hypothetical protein
MDRGYVVVYGLSNRVPKKTPINPIRMKVGTSS